MPIRCPWCVDDPNVRARLLAEVIVTLAGYDVWVVRPLRRVQHGEYDRDLGPSYVPTGIRRRRAAPDEFVPCKRRHGGSPGGVTLSAATITEELQRASAPVSLPRIAVEPDEPAYYPQAEISYAEAVTWQRSLDLGDLPPDALDQAGPDDLARDDPG
jgi:hypothetical protein